MAACSSGSPCLSLLHRRLSGSLAAACLLVPTCTDARMTELIHVVLQVCSVQTMGW